MSTPAPLPAHLLRLHLSAVTCLDFSNRNERIYSGDSSGVVAVTSTRSLRAIASWQAHTDALLGVQEWSNRVVTHGRDNKLHIWMSVEEPPASAAIGGSAEMHNLPTPISGHFDTTGLPPGRESTQQEMGKQALIALPNLIESSLADVWVLPSCQRVHAGIGTPPDQSIASVGRGQEGIIMSLHLYSGSHPTKGASVTFSTSPADLRLLCAHESGGVILRRHNGFPSYSVEGAGWETIWKTKVHSESIMAMRVSPDNAFALTVSADHLVGRYNLQATSDSDAGVLFRTKHPGNAAVAISHDGRVCAIAGWDGKIRLCSTKTLKPLGTLSHHKQGCQAVEFARALNSESGNEAEDDLDQEELEERARWLVAGGNDTRVSVWVLMKFSKG